MGHDNPLLPKLRGGKLSPLLREKVLFLGQEVSLENASEVLYHMLGVKVSDSTFHRELECYGSMAEEWIREASQECTTPPIDNHEVVYCQADGSMILTRDSGWKEVKLGRIFRSDAIVDEDSNRRKVGESQYVGKIGTHLEFIQDMDRSLNAHEPLKDRLVFISDGAPWIKNWINDMYPEATQILDYYHAVEHLGKMAVHITHSSPRAWIKRYADKLLTAGIDRTIRSLKCMPIRSKEGKECKAKLLQYFEANAYRMDYPKYERLGYYIGSGAIESAHRTVVQKRLKLSGQRWTIEGAQRILNLRVLNMSGKWNVVTDHLRHAA